MERLYKLADVLQMPLAVKKTSSGNNLIIAGKITIGASEDGLVLPVPLKIVAGFASADECTPIGVVCKAIGDLYLFVAYDPEDHTYTLAFLDVATGGRSLLIGALETSKAETVNDALEALAPAISATYIRDADSFLWDALV